MLDTAGNPCYIDLHGANDTAPLTTKMNFKASQKLLRSFAERAQAATTQDEAAELYQEIEFLQRNLEKMLAFADEKHSDFRED